MNGLAPCFKCPQGFYSDKDNKFKSCKACDTAKTTIKEGSKSDADCIGKCINIRYHDSIYSRQIPLFGMHVHLHELREFQIAMCVI